MKRNSIQASGSALGMNIRPSIRSGETASYANCPSSTLNKQWKLFDLTEKDKYFHTGLPCPKYNLRAPSVGGVPQGLLGPTLYVLYTADKRRAEAGSPQQYSVISPLKSPGFRPRCPSVFTSIIQDLYHMDLNQSPPSFPPHTSFIPNQNFQNLGKTQNPKISC